MSCNLDSSTSHCSMARLGNRSTWLAGYLIGNSWHDVFPSYVATLCLFSLQIFFSKEKTGTPFFCKVRQATCWGSSSQVPCGRGRCRELALAMRRIGRSHMQKWGKKFMCVWAPQNTRGLKCQFFLALQSHPSLVSSATCSAYSASTVLLSMSRSSLANSWPGDRNQIHWDSRVDRAVKKFQKDK